MDDRIEDLFAPGTVTIESHDELVAEILVLINPTTGEITMKLIGLKRNEVQDNAVGV